MRSDHRFDLVILGSGSTAFAAALRRRMPQSDRVGRVTSEDQNGRAYKNVRAHFSP
jgi:hypothetical protein